MADDDHPFGGAWTEVKLRALTEYMQMYCGALSHRPTPERPFKRWYIDAFAGSGRRTQIVERGGIFEGEPRRFEKVMLAGSARRAISVSPWFDHLVFIEQDAKRFAALQMLKAEFPDRSISTIQGDANDRLAEIFHSTAWSAPGSRGAQRGIVFLDPYGMGVKWRTLELLAETQRVDVWYLFPLNAVVRQAAKDFAATDESKRRSLTEIFGTSDWKEQLYRERPMRIDLFDGPVSGSFHRDATPVEIEAYARLRLQTLFRYVSKPIPLMARSQPFFSLFCLSNNPSGQALGLIGKLVDHVVKKYTMASHRRYGLQAGGL